jgi:hypothetical protein
MAVRETKCSTSGKCSQESEASAALQASLRDAINVLGVAVPPVNWRAIFIGPSGAGASLSSESFDDASVASHLWFCYGSASPPQVRRDRPGGLPLVTPERFAQLPWNILLVVHVVPCVVPLEEEVA